MADRLPPLTALRAFEAAARHLSFAKAADELNVTPAALSFQIKSLEEHLGAPLFRRLNRAVELTEAGRALAPGASDGFDMLGRAWRQARRVGDTSVINVTAGPAFTARWLAPRMFVFARAHPEIELRFTASLRIMDLERDEVDVAIRFGYGGDEDAFAFPLIREWLTPMMSPEMAETFSTPESLTHATLLHQDDIAFLDPPADWAEWFRIARLEAPTAPGLRFSQADHAIDAALAGAGVALGRVSLASKELDDGRLVAPFPLALTTEAHYRLMCPRGAENRPQIRDFIEWVTAEAETMAHLEEGRIFVAAGSELD